MQRDSLHKPDCCFGWTKRLAPELGQTVPGEQLNQTK
jgi:hypothetical protein